MTVEMNVQYFTYYSETSNKKQNTLTAFVSLKRSAQIFPFPGINEIGYEKSNIWSRTGKGIKVSAPHFLRALWPRAKDYD